MTTSAITGPKTSITDTALLAAVLGAIPRPVLTVSPDVRVLAANSLALDLLPALRPGDPLVLALRNPTVLDAIRRVEATGAREVVTWRERVPVERVFEVTVALIDAPDTPRVVALTLDDLTASRRVERMRADFIANASHELRTPLASLLGFVETLQGPARDDPQARQKFLGIMAEQARRMARLIDDLLSLSRIEQKRHIKPSIPVDLSAVVLHVADTLGPLAGESGVSLNLKAPRGVVVLGDRDELVRVAENLIENAIKYGTRAGAQAAGEGPRAVDITVAAHRRHAVLTVRDHGDGISAEHLPRLTERFYRIDAGQSRARGGTGLGLALVKHVVAHHRGRLEIDSTVGEGSVFTVLIPLEEKKSV